MDVEKLATLYQRRYNIMSKIGKETDEILLAAERQDNVSLDLLLDLRQESLGEQSCSAPLLPEEKGKRFFPTNGKERSRNFTIR